MPAKPPRYVLGLDFGTLSARAVLVETATGREAGSAVSVYKHGVIEKTLPNDKKPLPPETALQDPRDYLEALAEAVPAALRTVGADRIEIGAIGVDFTSCTMLPVLRDGTPLCVLPKFAKNPHAWVKLWKHHAAQAEATAINDLAREREPGILRTYGGSYSSEWFFSKVLETARKAPKIYEAAERFIEAGDWLVWQLTGRETRNISAAGFKGMRVIPDAGGKWHYPDGEFFAALHPSLRNVHSKIDGPVLQLGERAGELAGSIAERIGLNPGVPVAAANIDAHSAVPACGVAEPGRMVMILGTSTCHMVVGTKRVDAEGICGVVQDGIIPGSWGYEAGQPGVGDLFGWFVEKCLQEGTTHEKLQEEAALRKPGASGLLALDWWNGNRSVLSNSELSGCILGLTLSSTPADIYRALIEATAFGTCKIIGAFTREGIEVKELVACGGLAHRNKLMLQIYADVTGRRVRVAESEQASALGAAMHGAVAAGIYPNIRAAAKKMARLQSKVYSPQKSAEPVYDELYKEYTELHDHFGRGGSRIMMRLKNLRNRALGFA